MRRAELVGDAVEGVGHQLLEPLVARRRSRPHDGVTPAAYIPSGGGDADAPAGRARRGPAPGGHHRRRRPLVHPAPAPGRARPGCSPAASPSGSADRRRRRPPRPGPHLHPQGGGRAARPGCGASACATRSPPARSTPSPTPSCGPAGPTRAARRRRCSTARPGCSARIRRRRAPLSVAQLGRPRSSGPRPGWSAPDGYADARPPARGAGAGSRRPGGRALRALRGREARRRAWSTSTTCCAVRADLLDDRRDVRRRPAVAVPAPVRRRVPGRQPAAAPAARGLAGRPAPTCASSATPTRRSTAGTAPTPASSTSFRRLLPRRRGRACSTTTTARRPRSSPSPPRCCAAPASTSAARPRRPDGRRPAGAARASSRRARRGASAVARAVRDRHAPRVAVVGAGRARAHQRPGRC